VAWTRGRVRIGDGAPTRMDSLRSRPTPVPSIARAASQCQGAKIMLLMNKKVESVRHVATATHVGIVFAITNSASFED